ncbi:hypothetical protein AB9Q04_01690 [Anaerococcus sp. ENR1011]|uniref:GA module n=1 Tax=Anaerococcus groningensis TaxID=3115616 RepID=A0ABW9MZ34_9FIRM
MKRTKIKSYASLALALALVLPATAHAAGETKIDTLEPLTEEKIINDLSEKKQAISSKAKVSLDETAKSVNYIIDITKTQPAENLNAIFYISKDSNLENLEVLTDENISKDDIKTEDLYGGKKITIALKEATTINLRADIKEGKTDNLNLAYLLANEDETAFASKILSSSIVKDENDKEIIKANQITDLGSHLKGKFVDNETIEWSDVLINQTNEAITTAYPIKLSDKQTGTGQLTIQTYRPSKDGLVADQRLDLAYGNVKDLQIPANGAATLIFKTKVDQQATTFKANGAEVRRDIETSNQIKDLTETIDKNDQKIKEEMSNIDSDTKKEKSDTDAAKLSKELDDRNEEIKTEMQALDKKVAVDNKEKTTPKPASTVVLNDKSNEASALEVQSLIKELDDRTIEIQKTMQEIDKEFAWVNETDTPVDVNKEDSKNVSDLIKELDDRNKAIQDELEKIYGKYAVNSVMDLNKAIDNETYELITSVDKDNEKIEEIINQVNLSIESNKILDNKEEAKNIKALLENIEKLEANNEKVLEKVDQRNNDEEISSNFKNVVPNYSENVYKDLKKVVTVTLDPLNKEEATVSKEEASKNYPTIAKYLEDLKLVQDLLK